MDIMRGATIVFMVIVNNPGDWNRVWSPLDHAAWNGCTPADLVFPFFLFLMGCVIPFAFDRRLREGAQRSQLVGHIAWRGLALVGLKLILSLYPFFHVTHLRFFGVLTRIALCYVAAASLYLCSRKTGFLVSVIGLILLAYWAILYALPVPGLGWPGKDFAFLDPDQNMAAWLDRQFSAWCQTWLHTGVLYEKTWDPEGLLSTLPAIATTLSGVLAGQVFRRKDISPARRPMLFMAAGGASILLGLLWGQVFPLNKSLWTSSFTLVSSGAALCSLAVCDGIFDVLRLQNKNTIIQAIATFCQMFGMNAVFAFLFSGFLAKTLLVLPSPVAGSTSLEGGIYQALRAGYPSSNLTSFLFSCCFLILVFLPVYGLYRKKIFIRL
ncbi:acyltransferase family protein [Acetobacter senegalensis]|uniref:acyltransferase family protein n=1 Tax=Acetobacter senegalensis TaxID=446692 RepID=UPI002ED47B6B